MRVNVGPIKGRKGASIDVAFNERMKAPWDDNVVFVEAVLGNAKVTNTGRGFFATGNAKVAARITCDRCLEPFAAELTAEFEQAFRPSTAVDARRQAPGRSDPPDDVEEKEEPDEEDEVRTYDGETIDLAQTVSEAFLLSAPVKFVCREDCRGICPVCGTNRNVSECDCESFSVDPRLEGLAKLLEKNGHD